MDKSLKETFLEVDSNLFKVVETEKERKAFALRDDGSLKEVGPGYVMAVGTPILKSEFVDTQEALLSVSDKKSSPKPNS